jgi:ribonucleoside-diphosphate reductase alpha chain
MSLSELAKFTIISKYAKYLPEQQRRETWQETVYRCRDMHLRKYSNLPADRLNRIEEVFESVVRKEVAPSMRSLQFGGEAIERKNARMYNCSVTHIDSPRAIQKALWLLLCGCGVGLGFTEKYVSKYPKLISNLKDEFIHFEVEDTIEGWADSVRALLDSYIEGNKYSGKNIIFVYDKIRPKGSPLSIGGKAPGAKGLAQGHILIRRILENRRPYGFLRSIDLYDISMHCSDAVLSGGIRRSATIATFNIFDSLMMNAKTDIKVDSYIGNFVNGKFIGKVKYDDKWVNINIEEKDVEYVHGKLEREQKISWAIVEPQRARSNNSVVLNRNQIQEAEFHQIFNSTKQFGEPGFVFVNDEDALFNPCAEIGFIPVIDDEPAVQFCNLSIINGNKVSTKEDLMRAVERATIIGTLQAGYTDFPYLDEADKRITEEEALLGVSILGFLANPDILISPEILREASAYAVKVNEDWAQAIGINKASRITCVKPDGNSAAALESPFSGIHPAHSENYFRRVQVNTDENPYQYFKQFNGHICEPSVWSANKTDDVIAFPISIDQGLTKDDLSAIEHLEIIKTVQENWVNGGQKNNRKDISNSVSCTVLVRPDEWDDVAKYIFANKEYFSTVSLLAYNGEESYAQAPYESIKEKDLLGAFNIYKSSIKPVDYTFLIENDDATVRSEELACVGGVCSL